VSEVYVVLSTAASPEAGLGLGRNLVAERLAACVNVVPGARSVYWWEGKVEESDEALLIIKTERARYPALARRLQELHPYSVPEVLALPVDAGAPAYVAWVRASVGAEGGEGAP
jgi:periplasmic divalent cation tolerance protein